MPSPHVTAWRKVLIAAHQYYGRQRFDDIAIGKAVKLAFAPTEGGPPVPVFQVVNVGAAYQ